MFKIGQITLNLYPKQYYINASYGYKEVLINRKFKRGSMLSKMITNKDKDKNWHFNFMEKPPDAKSVFEKVHRPNKRQNVLDALFIKNITDVLSTGDVAPEILGYGVEICGVKVSPCFRILNVYWQIPPNSYDSVEEIRIELAQCAPRLRAELISRNVMGKVPHIFFIRDISNAKIAEFENALKDADLGPEDKLSVIPDDEFTKDILVFKTAKGSGDKENDCSLNNNNTFVPKRNHNLPQRPVNMKFNVFGLNHDILMGKVMSAKTKPKTFVENSAVISSEFFPTADLFDKIPGTPLQPGEDREKLLKQFQIERKMMKNRKDSFKITKEDSLIGDDSQEEFIEDRFPDGGDYIDEDNPEIYH